MAPRSKNEQAKGILAYMVAKRADVGYGLDVPLGATVKHNRRREWGGMSDSRKQELDKPRPHCYHPRADITFAGRRIWI